MPFLREKLISGMTSAAKGRNIEPEIFSDVANAIEEQVRATGGQATSDFVGLAVLEHLRAIDDVAALRFASVYKHFDTVADFEREATLIKRDSHPASQATADGLEASLN
jgi:transcriptional repressor NrdR